MVSFEGTRSAGPVFSALAAGSICAAGTAIGSLPVLFLKHLPQRISDSLLGFGGGIMLAATAFSLIVPAMEYAKAHGFGGWEASAMLLIGVMAGGAAILGIGHIFRDPHEGTAHPLLPSHALLFVVAMTAHNIPEGMAIGVAAAGQLAKADQLTLGMALQDLPEGLVVALVLIGAGMSKQRATLIGAATGLIEPVAAVGAAAILGVAQQLLPWALAFAAGAMLVASTEGVVVESHRNGNGTMATVGFCFGFCLMAAMDLGLG